jgi:cation-transporting ATPase 13A2
MLVSKQEMAVGHSPLETHPQLITFAGVIRDSSTLVPGDVVNLSSPSPSIFPADILLLSGDAIVNESMLTGESVPVSKISITNDDLIRWNEGKEVTAETAKGLLYTGTKVVRVRGNAISGMESPATGLVVRTAFNTTKGALVRSMLFPKPMGFKFYRDSMRFIAVLAGIAGLGFLISAVQFVRLGVSHIHAHRLTINSATGPF